MILTNGAEIIIDATECEIIGFDSSKPVENQVIIAKYKDLQATFTISVMDSSSDALANNSNGIPTGEYDKLSFKTYPKTDYKVGEWIDKTGGVLFVNYDDGSVREIPLDSKGVKVYGFTTDKPDKYTLTVKYVEGGFYGETTYEITVTE